MYLRVTIEFGEISENCYFWSKMHFFIPNISVYSNFSGAGKLYHAYWLRQVTRDVKSDVRILISELTSLICHHEKRQTDVRRRP